MISLATVLRIARRNQNATGTQFEHVVADGQNAIRRVVVGIDNNLYRAELIVADTARALWKETNRLARVNRTVIHNLEEVE